MTTPSVLAKIPIIDGLMSRLSPGWTDIPEWMRLLVLETDYTWTMGLAKTCVHSPATDDHGPAFGAAWKTGLVTCTACLPMLKPKARTDYTCDCCGTTVDPDHFHTGAIGYGGFLWMYGICDDCNEDMP